MRHTLIPTPLKKALRHEYRIRTVIVLLFMISAAFVIGIVSVLPAFIHAATEKNNAEQSLLLIGGTVSTTTNSDIDAELAAEKDRLSILNSNAKLQSLTAISALDASIAATRGSVRITSIATSWTGTTTLTAIVQGVAPTRDSLLGFQRRLQSLAPGNKVDLPVSQLAKGSDIQFSLSIVTDTSTISKP